MNRDGPRRTGDDRVYSATFTFAKGEYDDEFHRRDQAIAEIAKAIPGYLGEEAWENPATGLICNVYYWEWLEALQALMHHPVHLEAKARQADWLDRLLKHQYDSRILDVGAGDGTMLRLMKDRGYRDVNGLDLAVFFKQYWSAAGSVSESTAKLGLANTVASFCLGISAPFLGAIGDRSRGRKKLLFAFTFLGALSTASLFLVAQGNWFLAALLYVLGSMGFSGAQSFYDALPVAVAQPRKMDLVSGLGYGLGCLG